MGTDKVIDYTAEDFTDSEDRYDVIFEGIGKISKSNRKKALTLNEKYMSLHDKLESEKTENLVFLKELVEAEKIQPVINRTYSWEQIIEAHWYVDTGH